MRFIDNETGKEVVRIIGIPFFWPILKLFLPAIDSQTTIVTWGNRVYCRNHISADLWEHELVHCRQQGYSLIKGTFWCIRYLIDKKFRFNAELEAYRAQYQFVLRKDVRLALNCLMMASKDLSGPLYGYLVGDRRAIQLIQE